MNKLTAVTVDFDTSHLLFPKIIAVVLLMLGVMILIQERKRIAASGAYWQVIFTRMDKPRFFGTLVATIIYFSAMVPVGDLWPNTGLGFLICSIVYVFLVDCIFLHERNRRSVIPVAMTAIIAPALVWFLYCHWVFLEIPPRPC